MVLALMPVGQAAALGHPDEPRDTDRACPEDSYPNPYPDIFSANPHYHNVTCMTDYGIARGFADGTYRPPAATRRDQMATFIANLIREFGELETGSHQFDDVGTESPHYQNIHDLAEAGVVEGRDADTYAPRAFVRRDQMASFIARAIDYIDNGEVDGSLPPPAEGAAFYTDVFTANTHSEAIGALTEPAIVVGYGDDTYGPRDNTRRDQMASFIMRAYDYLLEQMDKEWEPGDPVTVFGEVVDTADGSAIAGATVTLTNGETYTATTGADGSYTITDVEPDTYTATADADGYFPESEDITVGDTETFELDFALTAEPVGATILSAELDTRDTPETPLVSEGDVWVIVFSESMDTDSIGDTIDLDEALDDGSFTVECVEDDTADVGDNTLALCEWGDANDGENNELTVTLLEDAFPPDDGYSYPVIITGTTLTTEADADVDVEGSDEEARTIGSEFFPPPEFIDALGGGSLTIDDGDGDPTVVPWFCEEEDQSDCVWLSGDYDDEDGTITFDSDGVMFPTVTDPETGTEIDVHAPDGMTGTFDPETGDMTLTGGLYVQLTNPAFALGDDCTTDVFAVSAESGPADPGMVNLLADDFVVPAFSGCAGGALDATVNGLFGTPGDGELALSLLVELS
jgi:hypothetical protein